MVHVRDACLLFLIVLHVTIVTQSQLVDPSECRSLMDLYVVIDGSDSISAPDFITLRKAMASLIPQIDLGSNKARIGMLVFSADVPVKSEHAFSDNPVYLTNAAMTLEHPRDGTNTALGIKHMRKMFETLGRAHVPWVSVVITDGISKDPEATASEAKLAEKMGINMFAVGIGHLVALEELEAIASTPKQVMAIDNFSQLKNMLSSMMTRICPCPMPPPQPLAKCTEGPRAIGSIRSYQCLDGYLQRGNPTITCQDDSTWTKLSLDFECASCGEAPVLPQSTCNGEHNTIDSIRTYKCNSGYLAVGNPKIQCLDNAMWSVPDFKCVPCGETPVIPNSQCGGGDYILGAVRSYVCNPGYLAVGSPKIQCLDNAMWSVPDFKCVPCGETPVIPNGQCGGGDYILGALRSYVCNPGYLAVGNPKIQCLDNAMWSVPDFKCVPCGETPVIPNGHCGGGDYILGAVRSYICNPRYLAVGNPKIQCLDNAMWSVPDFKCVPCGETPVIPNGQCGGGDYILGALRSYVCNPGYLAVGNPKIQCLDNAMWSVPDFKCVPCGETPVIPNGQCGGGDYIIGAVRSYVCNPGYLAVGSPKIQCLDNAMWSVPDFKCVPCGETPVIPNGQCGGGDYILGAVRSYICNPGYLAVGNPKIQCLDNAMWSVPDFKCVPCGETPVIPNGQCGGGDYIIGAVRSYVCNPGYLAVGSPKIQCLDNAMWSVPDFKCVPCGETPVIPNGQCGGGDYILGALRSYVCNPGYLAVGNPKIQCLDNAMWSVPDFKCVPCGETPVIPNGQCGSGDYILGAVRSYVCNPGYLAVGSPKIQCLDNAMWSVPDFKCVPCGETPVIPNGQCGGGDYIIGAVRSYVCNPGYLAVGSPKIQCLDNAMWSVPDFKCVPCGDTPVIPNSQCGGGDYILGALRSYVCNPGYLAVGNPKIQCLDNAMWSVPDFKCVPCGETPVIPNGQCGGGDYIIGAVRSYVCNPGYLEVGSPKIQCLDNAMWSAPDFKCVPCGETPVIPNGQCGGGDYILGAVRSYVCNPGYLPVGNPKIQCLDNAMWSVPDFKCVPCGETPVIANGQCGGGDYILGAVRSYICNPGYLTVGNPKIQCLDNAMWSVPDFKCVPCGETPVIPNGQCGGGDYIIGAVRSYVCNPGYLAVGSPKIQCLDNAMWSVPDFKCVPCGETPVIPNGQCGGGDYILGALRSYVCNPGYLAVGNPKIQCLDNAMWSVPDFKCVPCGETPVILNGQCGGGDYILGAVRSYVCNPGYLAVGSPKIQCLDNAMWSVPDFKCVPCGETPVIPNGHCGGGDYIIGAVRSYVCNPGYLAVGSPKIQCLDNAMWSVPDFKCVPCGDTPVIPNSQCEGGDYILGALRSYVCNPGYLAVGNPKIQCLDNAMWSVPDFKCVPCGETPVIPNGQCGGGEYILGALRSYVCNPGYLAVGNPKIKCLDNAMWSVPDFKCVPCGDTPVIPNGQCGGGDYILGAVRSYACNTGYLAVGNPKIQCLDNAMWSVPDFKCVPCGETPVISKGQCGSGDYILGAVRSYVCNPGYLAVGNPKIQCMDNAMWSVPDFKCVPCGETPVIPNGQCSGGDYILGAVRSYVCNPGYLAVGNPKIQCLDNAMWSVPDFKCVPCGETPVIPNGQCGGGDYVLGAFRSYVCNPGYLAVGSPKIQCLDNAMWSVPDFKCVPCGDTPVIPNGQCGGGDYILGAVRSYVCNTGYLAVGNPKIQCLDNAMWSVPDFKCVPCGETPVIPNGQCGGGDYILGAVRSYVCNSGYLAVGNPKIQCLDNAVWSVPDFKCVPCGETPVIPNGQCGGGDSILGALRSYVCNPGYLAVGNPKIQCLDNAMWSVPDFKCVPCGETPVIPNGQCGGGDYILGALRSYVCNPGYLAVGNPKIQCLDNAMWSVPDFKCVPCGETPVIPNGQCGGGEYILGAVRSYVCNPGYLAVGNPIIQCLGNAMWSVPDFKCVPCGETPVIPNGQCGGGDYILGAVRSYVCNPGYLAVGNPKIKCMDNAMWSVPDFKCVSCGETPVVHNGQCGGGDYVLGALRSYVCNPGYLAVGNPKIQCLDNAMWSVPDFKCVRCGETPVIPNGQCGGGDFILGAVRSYVCNPGYLAVGNPKIQCLDNAMWSVADFKCIPCGEPPLIPNGQCGGGEYTIGSVRSYECNPGYLSVGNPKIQCLHNAVWSKPAFKCISCGDTPVVNLAKCGKGGDTLGSKRTYSCEPGYYLDGHSDIVCKNDATWSLPTFKCLRCMDTPVIENAVCGSGEYLVGSKRTYTCSTGYLPQGTPSIECLANAQWSLPAFKCVGCGNTPPVANGFVGIGPSTIGSTREYYCDAGYEMVGTGRITCMLNGMWDTPQFSCRVKTTPAPTASPKPAEPSVCDACRLINGVGYNNHPSDCTQYVQCFIGTKGMEPVYRKCPFGQFWDQTVLTCRPANEVNCIHDKCAVLGVKSYKHTDPDNCCAYWKCDGGRSHGDCCAEGHSYGTVLRQCVQDSTCLKRTCPFDDQLPVAACDKRPTDKDTVFEQHIGNNYWVKMPCAPGTAFSPVDCQCSLFVMSVPGKARPQVCKPELYLPFENGFNDMSGKNVYILPENVTISNGAAYFDGRSRILINRFANTEFAGDLVIKFRYNELKKGAYYQKLQALVTNGDCGSDPSIVIAKMPGYILLGAKTSQSKSFTLPTLDKEWKDVVFMHNEKTLEGKVCGASSSKWSYGPIQATHCALQIGHGNGLQSFVGLIDDFYIYQCRPQENINVGY